jgi:hypothetical protein
MWVRPKNIPIPTEETVNQKLLKLEGELTDEQAMATMGEFFRHNLGLSCELLSGVKLAELQEIVLLSLHLINYGMLVFSRGGGKTFLAAVYCFLYCIFNPGTKIIVAGPTFRTARFIFGKIEEILKSPEAHLLQQCFGATSKRNDVFEWEINKGKIIAIPLNGEKIRGFRCNVLILDEANWLEQDMIEKVLMPFLVAPKDIGERLKQRAKEDELVASGKMADEERTQYDSDAKMILLSSAGYTFEYLYKLYQEWLNIIENTDTSEEYKAKARYFVCQLAYDAFPEEMMDQTIIKEAARNGGDANSAFKMEYGAQFCDGSDSYFNAKKMEECTLGLGEYPHTLIKGNPDKKYIISIDPNASDSPSADYFAIAILELDDDTQTATLVHGYQGLGGITSHVKYLAYVLANFNIVFGIGDAAGLDSFLDAANNSEEMMTYHKQLKYLDFDTTADGQQYLEQLASAKEQLNQESGKIIVRQYFTGEFIRRANEYLQSCINYKKIFFASKTAPNSGVVQAQIEVAEKLPRHLIFNGNKSKWSPFDFIDHQDDIIYQTKRQCSLVEFSATTKGSINFDLPQHMRRMQTADKPRKDNYSALVMANWAVKHYYALMTQSEKPKQKMFVPTTIK